MPDHPVLAVRFESGELFVTKQTGRKRETLYRAGEDIRNRWLDFRFHVRFSRSQNGRIKAWRGDVPLLDYQGVTAYPKSGGYGGKGLFYFKAGLYRDRMAQPMTIYFDEYRMQALPISSLRSP
jgi:hypothetical protein